MSGDPIELLCHVEKSSRGMILIHNENFVGEKLNNMHIRIQDVNYISRSHLHWENLTNQ